ncbi:unnamed protein product [Owenia fusiformis]|uniref:Uncharacterized protein n=1 Tax=Owenia fusiformis TaxID=6347 RepID=A0A8S4NXF0_OWEFU|nr:unnamed protein product [Owenia fusiformis]
MLSSTSRVRVSELTALAEEEAIRISNRKSFRKSRRCISSINEESEPENEENDENDINVEGAKEPTDPKVAAQLERKAKIAQELIDSEKTYQQHLELVLKYFQEPLLNSNMLPRNVVSVIFGNIEQIIAVNRALHVHLAHLDVGEAFKQLMPFLKLYSMYANGHERALATLMEWDQKSSEFAAFRRRQEDLPEVKGLKLNALLITPVQRIPRYKLMLEDLLKFTPQDSEDYPAIKDAAGEMQKVALHINEHVRQHENFQKMLAIQRNLAGEAAPKILAPGRVFLKEGNLMKIPRKGYGKPQERKFYLFSDMLMYAKPRLLENDHRSLTCCCVLPLKYCAVERTLGEKLFKVTCRDECLLLFSEETKEVDNWMSALQDAISELKCGRQTLRRSSSRVEPMRRHGFVKQKRMDKRKSPKKKLGVSECTRSPLTPIRRLIADNLTPRKKRKLESKKPTIGSPMQVSHLASGATTFNTPSKSLRIDSPSKSTNSVQMDNSDWKYLTAADSMAKDTSKAADRDDFQNFDFIESGQENLGFEKSGSHSCDQPHGDYNINDTPHENIVSGSNTTNMSFDTSQNASSEFDTSAYTQSYVRKTKTLMHEFNWTPEKSAESEHIEKFIEETNTPRRRPRRSSIHEYIDNYVISSTPTMKSSIPPILESPPPILESSNAICHDQRDNMSVESYLSNDGYPEQYGSLQEFSVNLGDFPGDIGEFPATEMYIDPSESHLSDDEESSTTSKHDMSRSRIARK